MALRDWWNSLWSRGLPPAPSTQRLDGRSKALLAASLNMLPYDMPGWITNEEAKQLFSPMGRLRLRRNGRSRQR